MMRHKHVNVISFAWNMILLFFICYNNINLQFQCLKCHHVTQQISYIKIRKIILEGEIITLYAIKFTEFQLQFVTPPTTTICLLKAFSFFFILFLRLHISAVGKSSCIINHFHQKRIKRRIYIFLIFPLVYLHFHSIKFSHVISKPYTMLSRQWHSRKRYQSEWVAVR